LFNRRSPVSFESQPGRHHFPLPSGHHLAKELASTRTTTVTLRVPTGLNERLDAYVHGAWPERVRKQELVTEALLMLIGRRGGPGQEAVDSDLLGDGSN
jgi:hypothetical protein